MRNILLYSFSFLMVLATQQVFAVGSGGIANPSLSARSSGMANAVTAVPNDPSTVWFNPAGMPSIATSFSIGNTFILSEIEFKANNGQTAEKDNDVSAVPNFYGNFKTGKNLAWGLSVNSPFGLRTKWPTDGPFRFVTTESELRLIAVNPAIAYQLNKALSIGIGLDYFNVTKVSLKKKINPNGDSEISGDGDGWGYNLGTLYRLNENNSLGATYRSQVKVRAEGTTKLTGLSAPTSFVFGTNYETPVETDITFPPSFTVGYAHNKGKHLLSFEYEWAGWSTWDENFLEYSETNPIRKAALASTNPIPRSWKDTSNFSIGYEYMLSQRAHLQLGYFFFDQVVPNRTFNPGIPENTRNGLTTGFGMHGEYLSFDVGYKLIFIRDRDVANNIGTGGNGSNVNGTYKSFGQTLGVNASCRFN